MGTFLFGLVVGGNLAWVFMSFRRDGGWREFNARRRGSNPPPPGRKPAPPAGPRYGWGPRQLNPPTPAPGMRREWLWSPSQMAECGGTCWEAQDPRCCDCGALWRDVPIRMDEGQTQRGNGNGGPTTLKPPIKPQPHGGRQLPNLFP
jgi:hypothetical protein